MPHTPHRCRYSLLYDLFSFLLQQKQSFHQKLFKFHFDFNNANSSSARFVCLDFYFQLEPGFYIKQGHKVPYHRHRLHF